MVYGLFMLIAGSASLFFLFNTGQVAQEKSHLVNTADAVAYSAGVLQARALNFDAYTNRALIANEVLVAQMVSLSSWSQYAQTHAENLGWVFPECGDPTGYGAGGGALLKYGPLYAAMCYLTVQYAGTYVAQVAEQIPPAAQAVVTVVELGKLAIKTAQSLLHAPGYFEGIRGSLMQEVADANYAGDGSVTVEPVGAGATGMNDGWAGFTRRFTGDDRGRIAEVVKIAADTDGFTRDRRWDSRALAPEPGCLSILQVATNKVQRRGGTELVGYDEWKAEDTESFWENYLHSGRFIPVPSCRKRERAIGYGEQQAHPPGDEEDASGARLGDSPRDNPVAHGWASSAQWNNYSGLPAFTDLDPNLTAKEDPRMLFGARVLRSRDQLSTSDARSSVRPSVRLNAYRSTVAGDMMAAVATAEVFFERPIDAKDNLFGKAKNQPRELGSLFNPYWQVRLVDSASDRNSLSLRQGAALP
ncbi:MAG: hypothetical protein JWR21_1153 [Herminiimonas sp.]|nr:hypothetical protein [Herminiimonas sp.]